MTRPCPEGTLEIHIVSTVLSGRVVMSSFPATAWLANFRSRFATKKFFNKHVPTSHDSTCDQARLSAERIHVIDDDAVPEGFTGGDKSGVVRAFGLIKLVVGKRLEMQGRCIVERVIGDGAALGVGRRAYIAALEVRDFCQATDLAIERGAFRRGKVLAEPENRTVNEHGFYFSLET